MKELIREEKTHLQIRYLGHLFMIGSPHYIFYAKRLMLDKEDNVMIYACSYSQRSYIVIDPFSFGPLTPIFASQKFRTK